MSNLVVALSPKEHVRIFTKISVDKKTRCWIWTCSKDKQGYGLVSYKGRTERIHRVMYAFFVKPIPRGTKARRFAQIDHICDNTSCCNPDHLELVTQKINTLRGNGITAMQARRTHCVHGHILKQGAKRRWCPTCDSIRHKKRMQGPRREYWLEKSRQATKRYYDKNK